MIWDEIIRKFLRFFIISILTIDEAELHDVLTFSKILVFSELIVFHVKDRGV